MRLSDVLAKDQANEKYFILHNFANKQSDPPVKPSSKIFPEKSPLKITTTSSSSGLPPPPEMKKENDLSSLADLEKVDQTHKQKKIMLTKPSI